MRTHSAHDGAGGSYRCTRNNIGCYIHEIYRANDLLNKNRPKSASPTPGGGGGGGLGAPPPIINSNVEGQACLLFCVAVGIAWTEDGAPHLTTAAGIGLQASVGIAGGPSIGNANYIFGAATSAECSAGPLTVGLGTGGTRVDGPLEGGYVMGSPGLSLGGGCALMNSYLWP